MNASRVNAIAWPQVVSLAFLAAAVVIGWVAYNQYQPLLLEQYNLNYLSGPLVIAQSIILFVTPPIAGAFADHFRRNSDKIIPLLASGVSFAAMIFMATALTLFIEPSGLIHWLLPVLILLWLISMKIFTSPSIASFELLAPVKKFPQVMAVLTIMVELLYSLEPVIVNVINYAGAPATFFAGGIVVLMAGLIFKRKTRQSVNNIEKASKTGVNDLFLIFLIGLGLGIPTAILFNAFPDLLQQKLAPVLGNNISGRTMVSFMLALSAVCCFPISLRLNTANFKKVFLGSLALLFILGLLIFSFSGGTAILVIALLYTVGFSFLSVSSLPWVLNKTRSYNKIFAIGIFFSAIELPDSLMEIFSVF